MSYPSPTPFDNIEYLKSLARSGEAKDQIEGGILRARPSYFFGNPKTQTSGCAAPACYIMN